MKPSLVLFYALALVVGTAAALYHKASNAPPTPTAVCCQADDGAPWQVTILPPTAQGRFQEPSIIHWSDTMGYVQEDGTFQAPNHPTADVDEVTGTNQHGDKITVWVRVDSPQSTPRFTSVPSWFVDPQRFPEYATHDKLNQYLVQWQGWLASDELSTELAVDGVQPQPLPGKSIPVVSNGQQSWVPSYEEGIPVSGVTFTPTPTNTLAQWTIKVKELGLWEDLPKRCREGEIAVRRSSWYNTVSKSSNWDEIASLTVHFNEELSVEIKKIFGLSFSAGFEWTGRVRTRSVDYTKSQIVESYKCLGGKWKLMERNRCFQTATGIETIPVWYCLALGYPAYGAPGKYSDLMCKPLAFK